jgi:thiol-disulfide isomerase/thioredoxin
VTLSPARVRAPELRGDGGWINTDHPLTLAELRGRVVLLDFWTFCCINCLRVIEELRPLEHRFGDALVVIGVHSPKFPHETDHSAVERAVRRHHVDHAVLDDPGLQTWQAYGVRAWPTLVVIDQEGCIAAVAAGEGNARAVAELIAALLEGRPAPPGPAYSPAPLPDPAALSFPGKVAADPGRNRIAVADTGHGRVLVAGLDGLVTHAFEGFEQPQGVRFDGERLLVCNTVAGTVEAVSLGDGAHTTLASGLRSPWDVLRLDEAWLIVAEAGTHRLLRVPADGGPFSVFAGSGIEGLRDGPTLQAHLAQPSGLARLQDAAVVFADSEVSALRTVRDGRVETLVGQGLFVWGDQDGDRSAARLQHPLAVAALGDGSVVVADTFNNRLRWWRDGVLSTMSLQADLDEPGGVDVLGDGTLVVADTGNHRILRVDVQSGSTSVIPVGDPATPELHGASGAVLSVPVILDLNGEELDGSQGPPVRVHLSADAESLLGAGPRSWALDAVPAAVEVRLGREGDGVLSVDVIAATCHGDVCTVQRSTRRHPLRVSASG